MPALDSSESGIQDGTNPLAGNAPLPGGALNENSRPLQVPVGWAKGAHQDMTNSSSVLPDKTLHWARIDSLEDWLWHMDLYRGETVRSRRQVPETSSR